MGHRSEPAANGRYILPYDPKSVSCAFTDACKLLGIADLRFHDLRREATSRLFELGYQIHEVTQFTLHRSWDELKRYTNPRPENMREILILANGERIIRQANVATQPMLPPPASELDRRRAIAGFTVYATAPITCIQPSAENFIGTNPRNLGIAGKMYSDARASCEAKPAYS
jgi:hypothetical protein